MTHDEKKPGGTPLGAQPLTAAEEEAAHSRGMHKCPACGDELPLELNEFECAGKGHHYAVRRDSVFPTPTPAQIDRDFRRAMQNVISIVIVFVVIVVVIVAIRIATTPLPRRLPAQPTTTQQTGD